MATPKGAALTRAHRAQQLRARSLASARAVQLWKQLDPHDLDARRDLWQSATLQVASSGQRISSAASARYLRRLSSIEQGTSLGAPITPMRTDETKLARTLSYAIARVKAGQAVREPLALSMRHGLSAATAGVSDHVLAGARETALSVITGTNPTMSSTQRPSRWSRECSGNACAFCQMIASRGAVYSSQSADFEAHANCACSAEPVYGDFDPSPAQQSARENYDAAVSAWKSGELEADDQLAALRRYLA